MSTSTIPAAIDGILATLKAATSLRGVDILDGEPTTNTSKDFIAIGYAEDGGEVVAGDQSLPAMGQLLLDESYEISCKVSAWTGSTTMKIVRDRAFTLFAAVDVALRAAPTLAGAVTFQSISRDSYSQYQTDQGAIADIDFSISVRAATF